VAQRIGDETIREWGTHAGKDPLIGATVDSYRIESIVGSGAMGIVYKARHTVISKIVAIKVLKPDFADDPEMVQRLVREARTVNAIHHPSIVDAFGFGTLPRTGQPYIVMDLLIGEPLDTYVEREAPVTMKEATVILDELLSALAAAHQVGVIHRDLKPGNCFLEKQPDGGRRLKLLDFGLARQADRAGGSIRPTNPGTLIGTPAFMAPEQVMGQKITPATDLYAVGGIAYQLLTGHLPHEAPSAIEVLTQKMKFDPVRPSQWNPTLDPDAEAWVMGLLERDGDVRERDAEAARRSLRRLSERRTMVGGPGLNPVPAAEPAFPPTSLSVPKVKTGVVPKRDWAEARTMLVEGVNEPPAPTTESHVSPWSAKTQVPSDDPMDSTLLSSNRGTALPLPLGVGPVPSSRVVVAQDLLGSDISTVPPPSNVKPSQQAPTFIGGVAPVSLPPPELTPPMPTLGDGNKTQPPIVLDAPTDDEPIELPQSQRGLVIALVCTICVLLGGVAWLVKLLWH
jgi:serine/threonine-protein kinase